MERIDKLIANTGKYSRKDARQLVRAGMVTVNGIAPTSADIRISRQDILTVKGEIIDTEMYSYIMMNKPQGVVCATRDNLSKTVIEILPKELTRPNLFPAGRLDKDTTGFVLITDDGGLAHKMLSPKNKVPKTYHATLDREIDHEYLAVQFAGGLDLGDGDSSSGAILSLLETGQNPVVELVIYEGIFHQVKRMFSKFSVEVIQLERVRIGNLWLDKSLQLGQSKKLLHKDLSLIL